MREITTEQLLEHRELSSFTSASVFGALQEHSILWLLRNGTIRMLDSGDVIFTQGQPGNSFHVILEGCISYYKYHQGHYAFIRDYKEGEQIGFMSLIALHQRVGRGEAQPGTVTLEIDSAVFHNFHTEEPAEFGILMMNLAREMARSLRSVDNLVVTKSREE